MLKMKILMAVAYTILTGCVANSPQTDTTTAAVHQPSPLHDDTHIHGNQANEANDIAELEIFIYPQRIDEEGYTVKVDVE